MNMDVAPSLYWAYFKVQPAQVSAGTKLSTSPCGLTFGFGGGLEQSRYCWWDRSWPAQPVPLLLGACSLPVLPCIPTTELQQAFVFNH